MSSEEPKLEEEMVDATALPSSSPAVSPPPDDQTTPENIYSPPPDAKVSSPPHSPLMESSNVNPPQSHQPLRLQPQPPPHPPMRMKGIMPTLFGDTIREKNVTFCIDTSGSMFDSLDVVKEHLIEMLLQRAHSTKGDTMFNVIEFSTEVMQWADKLVKCTPQTVAVASKWIKKLAPKTGTNTQDAIISAFADPLCEAVCLVTDGLPDQHPTDVLDQVGLVNQNRAVHCYYIETEEPDTASVEFLQDLAMESYGSFHIIRVTKHGSIEKITPIYRAEAAAERIIRTNDGNVYPSNFKMCSVGTTVNTPTDVIVETEVDFPDPYVPSVVRETIVKDVSQSLWPHYAGYRYPHPGRYHAGYGYPYGFPVDPYMHHNAYPYYDYCMPYAGWSRYRPVKAALSSVQVDFPELTPGAGAMLVGTKVLARRNEDGYFYLGTVKSQILANKFLVEFGPCKHGKYKDTVYQETYIFDILSYDDAQRHAVLPGDKVLVPWEPEGEKYGPGTVLQGSERRAAEGGMMDQNLVVSFARTGKSVTVPKNIAVWVPSGLHERVTFELQLPSKVRKEFSDKGFYPEENLPGYPTSGVQAQPREYDTYDAQWVERQEPTVGYSRHPYPYMMPNPAICYKFKAKPVSEVRCEEVEQLIPGTDMTKAELNEKVMSQLMQHKMGLEDHTKLAQSSQRILQRRTNIEDNTLTSSRKSVRFTDDMDTELDEKELENRDSGLGSATDLGLSDVELDDEDYLSDPEPQTADAATGTDSSLFYRRKRKHKRPSSRPAWKYWNNEPTPTLMDPMHYGPYRVGPYDECLWQAPIESRNQMRMENKEGVAWATSLSQYVDPFAKHKYDPTVKDSMGYSHVPRPPADKQGPGREIGQVLGQKQIEMDKLMQLRQNYRRQRSFAREEAWQNNVHDWEKMEHVMQDQHRQRILSQIGRDRDRQHQDFNQLQQLREAKKQVNDQLRSRIEVNQERERSRDDGRLVALRARRERREGILEQRQHEIEETATRKQAIREQRVGQRWNDVSIKLAAEDTAAAEREARRRCCKIHRFEQFHRREEENQQWKSKQQEMAEQRNVLTRSRIFP